jgi:hypothetical protein
LMADHSSTSSRRVAATLGTTGRSRRDPRVPSRADPRLLVIPEAMFPPLPTCLRVKMCACASAWLLTVVEPGRDGASIQFPSKQISAAQARHLRPHRLLPTLRWSLHPRWQRSSRLTSQLEHWIKIITRQRAILARSTLRVRVRVACPLIAH